MQGIICNQIGDIYLPLHPLITKKEKTGLDNDAATFYLSFGWAF